MFKRIYLNFVFDGVPGVPERLNYAVFLLFAGFLCILPTNHTVTVREMLFFSLLLITLWASWRKKLKLYMPMPTAWLLYTAIAFFSLAYALDPVYSLKEIRNEVSWSMLIMLITASWVRNERSLSRLIWLLISWNIFLVCLAVGLGEYLLISFGRRIASAPFIGVGKFSTYIVIVLPLIAAAALQSLKRNSSVSLLLLLLLVFNLVALYFTDNRISWLCVITEFALMFGLIWRYNIVTVRRRGLFLIGSLVLMLLLVFNFATFGRFRQAKSFDETVTFITSGKMLKKFSRNLRIDLWDKAFENIKDAPFSGAGFGRETFKMLNPEFSKTHRQLEHAHNIFLDKGVQMGIPGVLSFCLLLWSAFREVTWPFKHDRGNRESIIYAIAGFAMIAGMIIKNLTDDFFVRDNAWMFWLITAAIIGACKKDVNGQPLENH